MKTDKIRRAFLDYFKQQKHKEILSSPLPIDEPTLLFTVAGMVPLKKFFLGEDIPSNPRLTSSQRCLRTNDIDQVGKTPRHLTFFEMLGNFSIGDYFKKDAIAFAWDFLHHILEIQSSRLWATVYPEDIEAYQLWKKHLPEGRIIFDEENFWKMANTGPSGFDSEIYYDITGKTNCPNPECNPLCNCGRFMEIWNLVFMEFNLDLEGKRQALPQKNIDTGMGLERLSAVMQEASTNFDTDLFIPIIKRLENLSSKNRNEDLRRFRMIADHSRALVFLTADGVFPENQKHGYVLRRLLRRAKLAGFQLGIRKTFLWDLCDLVIDNMKDHYDYLLKAKEKIKIIVNEEENQFQNTLDDGFRIFADELEKTQTIFSGKIAFKLHDTYGFPIELTRELLEEHHLALNENEFAASLEEQRKKGKKVQSFQSLMQETEFWVNIKNQIGPSSFLGYEKENEKAVIRCIIKDGQLLNEAREVNGQYLIILDQSPFYPEKGGPVGDRGKFISENGEFQIENTASPIDQLIVHQGILLNGALSLGETVTASVDHLFRKAIRRSHTATHLLHVALKSLVGDYVNQAGSWIEPDYFRFDFNALRPLEENEILKLEDMVNAVISKGIYVCAQDMSFQEAMEEGATALFKEKYGEQVRVVSIENISKELCGGIHTQNTCEIRLFRILNESSIGSNLRRIEAAVGDKAIESYREDSISLRHIHQKLHKPNLSPLEAVGMLTEELKNTQQKLKQLQDQYLQLSAKEWRKKAESINKITLLSDISKEFSMDQLKLLCDLLRHDFPKQSLFLFFNTSLNPASFVLASSKDLDIKSLWLKLQEEFNLKGGGPPHLITGSKVNFDQIPLIQKKLKQYLNEIPYPG